MRYSAQFCGAAGEVTGSMHLLDLKDIRILLDAGAYQGPDSKSKNREKLPFNPKKIDYIIISHAHLDHVGRLPLLCQRGFEGEIISTRGTQEIAFRVLEDSLKIQQEEEGELSFSEEDLNKAKSLFRPIESESGEWSSADGKIKAKFVPSEHILGSVAILIEEPVSLLYTGDLGSDISSLHSVPKPPESCDYLIVESTYGDRNNEQSREDILQKLRESVQRVAERGGKLLIPVFSVDRAEEILFLLREANMQEKVYLDTPMGVDILDVYSREKYHLSRIASAFRGSKAIDLEKIFRPPKFERIRSNNASQKLAASNDPCVVLASSGMLEGGRIRNHLPNFLRDEKNLLLFSGFQANGTLGRAILDGAKKVKIDDTEIEVNAEIARLEGLSAHADKNGLLRYLSEFKTLPIKTFIVHGEPNSAQSLAREIQAQFKIRTVVPTQGEIHELSPVVTKETVVTKTLSIEGVDLKFDAYKGRRIALFLGGVEDAGKEFRLVKMESIEKMIEEARVELVRSSDHVSESSPNETEVVKQGETVTEPENVEISKTLLDYFNAGIVSKGLIRDLIDAAERGVPEFMKTVEKKVKNDALLLDEYDLKRKKIELPDRRECSEKLRELLRRGSLLNNKALISLLNEVFDKIK